MEKTGIILLGLGPGDPALLTRQAWDVINSCTEIYLRTSQFPVAAVLPASTQVFSFDDLYQTSGTFTEVYAQIVTQILELGKRPQGVVYAVPGHPFIAEATSPEIARQARLAGIPVQIVPGLSFIEPVFTALGTDPFPQTSLVDALELVSAHHPSFPPSTPALIAQLYSIPVATEVKLTLMEVFPDEHPVRLVHAAGTDQELVEELPLYAIDRSNHIGLMTALFVPPLDLMASFEAFQEMIAHLRSPEGCPWDRDQTHLSLRPFLLEETYEVLGALDAENPETLQEELGDLLLQIGLHAQIASEEGEFTMEQVLQKIQAKLIFRHPHVFSDWQVKDKQTVLENWEKLKAIEREGKNHELPAGIFEGIENAMPALAQAEIIQKRAARVGFDWKDLSGVTAKLVEELVEVQQAEDPASQAGEIGDLLFSVVNLARWLGVDAESALRETNARFRQRFAAIESEARQQGRDLGSFSLEEMDQLWEASKDKA